MKVARIIMIGLFAGTSMPAAAVTLEEAIAAAVAHTPEIVAARADSDAAAARLREAKADSLPTATLTGTIGVGRLDPQNFFGLGAANVTPRAGQVTIEQPLYAGGRVSAGIAQANAGNDAARAGEDATRSQMVATVAQAYGDVLTSRRLMVLSNELVAQMQEIERQARLRYKAGESPSTEVAQAAARLAEAQAGLAQAQGFVVSANARFSILTGLSPEALEPLPANPALPATLDEAMDAALQHNPWLAGAEAGVRAARAAAWGARAERLPTVGAFAEGTMVRDQFFPGYRADSATVGVRARWQIFNAGASAKVAESDSSVRAAEARFEAARNQVREQVIAAFQAAQTALLVEEASARQAESARQARDSVAHEVRVGLKPQIDLLNAEREATGAAAALAKAQTDRVVAAYRLLSLMG
ncbi:MULTISPECIES: TolC family protein [unclassified Sphingobium]|uniref:TolC family protein n=1 Tax=unclassified Sphingobium TaxID=2611147 RepID=UPI00222524BD|nr:MULTISPECIES: TolC family protein [unclassified Sphingobium]MCW2380631.1 outer membrane protein [Sphingobium sp. B2D3B]MCW2399261.1 outer membrane protein [Sphingobium sp. B2D3C]